MQPFIVQLHVAVGTAGSDTTPASGVCSGRKREVLAVEWAGIPSGVLALPNSACPGSTGTCAWDRGTVGTRAGQGQMDSVQTNLLESRKKNHTCQ